MLKMVIYIDAGDHFSFLTLCPLCIEASPKIGEISICGDVTRIFSVMAITTTRVLEGVVTIRMYICYDTVGSV